MPDNAYRQGDRLCADLPDQVWPSSEAPHSLDSGFFEIAKYADAICAVEYGPLSRVLAFKFRELGVEGVQLDVKAGHRVPRITV